MSEPPLRDTDNADNVERRVVYETVSSSSSRGMGITIGIIVVLAIAIVVWVMQQ